MKNLKPVSLNVDTYVYTNIIDILDQYAHH